MGKQVVGVRLSLTAVTWLDRLMEEYEVGTRSEVLKTVMYVGRENEERVRYILREAQKIRSNGVVEVENGNS